MNKNIPYSLLAKYFSGQCSVQEKTEIEQWKNENAEQQELFCKLERQWKATSRDITDSYIPDKGMIWQKIQHEINQKSRQVPSYTRTVLIRVAGIAAMLAVVLTVSTFMLLKNTEELLPEGNKSVVIAPAGQKSQLILADGTQVWLNSGTKLTYDDQYSKTNRIVNLEGEAYFEVQSDQQNPFTVKAGEVEVKVHGTSFNVQAYSSEKDIIVSLLTGSVSLLRSADQELLSFLKPNQSAVISRHELLCTVTTCDAETDASWHLNKLKFEGATAENVWRKVERWYGVNITLYNNNPENKYWFSLKTESLTELLRMIDKLTPIEYQLNGEEVVIRYK